MNHHIEWAALPTGTHRLRCPACGRDRRADKTLGVTLDALGAGVAHCFRCAFVETYRADRPSRPTEPPAPAHGPPS